MKKLNLVKNILFVVAASLFVVFTIVMWAQSFDNSKWESSNKIKFSEEYVIYLVIGLSLLFVSIYNLYCGLKNVNFNKTYGYGAAIVATGVYSLYKLSLFFSALLDYWDKEYFVYKDNQWNLYIGLVYLVLASAFVIALIKNSKESK